MELDSPFHAKILYEHNPSQYNGSLNVPPAGANCTDPPPTALYQNVSVDPACTYVDCKANYTCNGGLTLSDGQSSYQLTCMQVGSSIFTASWDTNTRICCKELYDNVCSSSLPTSLRHPHSMHAYTHTHTLHTIMHTHTHNYAHTLCLMHNGISFSAQRCNFLHNNDTGARGISVTYEPGGCESMFDTTNCDANYTYFDQSATCSCTRDDTTGSIECFSDSVANLTAEIPITTTPAPTTDPGPLLSKFNWVKLFPGSQWTPSFYTDSIQNATPHRTRCPRQNHPNYFNENCSVTVDLWRPHGKRLSHRLMWSFISSSHTGPGALAGIIGGLLKFAT